MKQPMYYVTAEESSGTLDLTPFPDTLYRAHAIRQADAMLYENDRIIAVTVWEVTPGLWGETHRRIYHATVPWSH